MITYDGLIQFCIMIISIVNLIVTIYNNRKK